MPEKPGESRADDLAIESLDRLSEQRPSNGAREIVTSRVLDAPRALVFEAWTSPQHVRHWWGPDGFTTTIHEMDVRPGGVWRFVMHGPDGDYDNKIVFVELKAPERLVYDHVSGPVFRSTVIFEDLQGRTKVTMRAIFESEAGYNVAVNKFRAVEGGIQHLARLGDYVQRQTVS